MSSNEPSPMTESAVARPMSGNPAPVDAGQRHRFVDALRGFALLGIIVVNIEYIVQPASIGWHEYTSTIDRVARWIVLTFGQTKIYPIFAALFGYGLALQFQRAEQSTRPGSDVALRTRHRRRMAALVVGGMIHGVVFFPGDILVIYGVIGALCFRLRHWSTGKLVRFAACVYTAAAIFWLAIGVLDFADGGSAPMLDSAELATLTNGTFLDVVGDVHISNWIETLLVLSIIQGPAVVASYAMGLAVGRTDLLSHPERHADRAKSLLVRWAVPVLAVAGLGGWVSLASIRSDTLGFAISFTIAPAVGAVYLAVLGLTIGSKNSRAGSLLQKAGSMSLTVYLAESVVLSTLAYGYGAGLVGRVAPLGGIVLAVAVWLGLSLAAAIWMRRARFGPLEWALRSFSYRRVQPMRRTS